MGLQLRNTCNSTLWTLGPPNSLGETKTEPQKWHETLFLGAYGPGIPPRTHTKIRKPAQGPWEDLLLRCVAQLSQEDVGSCKYQLHGWHLCILMYIMKLLKPVWGTKSCSQNTSAPFFRSEKSGKSTHPRVSKGHVHLTSVSCLYRQVQGATECASLP